MAIKTRTDAGREFQRFLERFGRDLSGAVQRLARLERESSTVTRLRPQPTNRPTFDWEKFLASTRLVIEKGGFKALEPRAIRIILRNWEQAPLEWVKRGLLEYPKFRERFIESAVKLWRADELNKSNPDPNLRRQIADWALKHLPPPESNRFRLCIPRMGWALLAEKDLPEAIARALFTEDGAIPTAIGDLKDLLKLSRLSPDSAIFHAVFVYWSKLSREKGGVSALAACLKSIQADGDYYFLRAHAFREANGRTHFSPVVYSMSALLLKDRGQDMTIANEISQYIDFTLYGDPRDIPLSTHWQKVRELDQDAFQQFLAELTKDDLEFFFGARMFANAPARKRFWLKQIDSIQRTMIVYPYSTVKIIENRLKSGAFSEKERNILGRSFCFNSRSLAEANQAILVLVFARSVVVEAANKGFCRFYDRRLFEERIQDSFQPSVHEVRDGFKIGIADYQGYSDFHQKNKRLVTNEIPHNGGWEIKFEEELYGIKYNTPKNVDDGPPGNIGARRTSSPVKNSPNSQKPNVSGQAPVKDAAQILNDEITMQLPTKGLAGYLRAKGFQVIGIDELSGGLWILYHPSFPVYLAALEKRGFRFRLVTRPPSFAGGQPAWVLES